MKKYFASISLLFFCLAGHSQYKLKLTSNGYYTFGSVNSANPGSITLTTSSDFTGTTTSDTLQATNDPLGTTGWINLKKGDDVTSMTHILNTASKTYSFELVSFRYKFYRIKYTTNGSGYVTAVLNINP